MDRRKFLGLIVLGIAAPAIAGSAVRTGVERVRPQDENDPGPWLQGSEAGCTGWGRLRREGERGFLV